jgi:hypothetical protein
MGKLTTAVAMPAMAVKISDKAQLYLCVRAFTTADATVQGGASASLNTPRSLAVDTGGALTTCELAPSTGRLQRSKRLVLVRPYRRAAWIVARG